MPNMRSLRFTTLLATVLIGAACAIGNRHRYDDVVMTVQASGHARVAVAVLDHREYVVNGNKGQDFVGLSRGGYGNPFNVTTASGRPLAQEMTDAIVASLGPRGFRAMPVSVAPLQDAEAARRRLAEAGVDRAVLLTLREWKADTFQNTALLYDVSLQVLDGRGAVMTEKNAIGKDNLGGSFWNPPAHARTAVPVAFREKVAALLNDRSVVEALATQ